MYSDVILRDNPVGYWPLEVGYTTNDVSALRQSPYGPNAASIGASVIVQDVQPLIMSSTNGCKITSSALSTISIANNYNVFTELSEDIDFSIEFWLAFDSIPTGTKILSITDDTNESVSIYIDSDKLRLNVYTQTASYTSTLSNPLFDSQFHVSLIYASRTVSLVINGARSTSIDLSPTEMFKALSDSTRKFKFGPATETDYFIVDQICFYGYAIEREMISRHLNAAYSQRRTDPYITYSGGAVLDIHDNLGSFSDYYLLNNRTTWSNDKATNSLVQRNAMTFQSVDRLTQFPIISTGSSAYSFTKPVANGTEGITFTTSSYSLRNEYFSKIFRPDLHALSCSVYLDVSKSSAMTYMSISELSVGTLLLERTTDDKIQLSFSGDSGMTMTTAAFTVSGWHNILIYFVGNTAYFNVDGIISSVTTTSTAEIFTNPSMTLYVGNSFYANATKYQLTDPIAKIGVVNKKDVLNGTNISNYLHNTSFRYSASGYSNPATGTASISRDYSYAGPTSLKWTRTSSSLTDTTLVYALNAGSGYYIPSTGSYTLSGYFFLPPTSSTFHGRSVAFSASGGTASAYTVNATSSATLSRGRWVRASTTVTFNATTASQLPALVASIASSASTDVGEILYMDAFKLESGTSATEFYNGDVESMSSLIYPLNSSASTSAEQYLEWIQSVPLSEPENTYVYLPGAGANRLSVPNQPEFSVTDLDIRAVAAFDTLRPASNFGIAGKYSGTASTSSWYFELNTNGTLRINVSSGASLVNMPVSSSAIDTSMSGTPLGVRVTYSASSGKTNYYTSMDFGVSWSPLGTERSGTATSVNVSTQSVAFGSYGTGYVNGLAGKYYKLQLMDSIDGNTILDIDTSKYTNTSWSPGQSASFTALTGQTVTLNSTGGSNMSVRSDSIVGSKIYYNSDNDNVQIYTSTDGNEWRRLLKNGDKIPSVDNYSSPNSLQLKVKMFSSDSDSSKNNLSYLEMSTYNDINVYGNNIVLSPPVPNLNKNYSYQLRSNNYNILSRSENFGIRFQKPNRLSETPGYATIISPSVGAIEMFFRIDDIYTSASNLSILEFSGVANSRVYYKPSDGLLYFDSGAYSSVFINGIETTSASKPIAQSEIYHLVAVMSSVQTGKTMLVNSSASNSPAVATYGYFKTYPQQMSTTEASQRYYSTIGINGLMVKDKTSTVTTYDSVAAYKIRK